MNKTKRLVRAGLLGIAAGAALYCMGLAKTYVVVPRYLNMLEDKYEGESLEQVASEIKTWENARDYIIRHLRFEDKIHESNENVHKTGKAYCFETMQIAEYLLADNNKYECSRAVFARKGADLTHAVALVKDKETGLYGSLGIHACDCIKPVFSSKEKVLKKIQKSFLWRCGEVQE